MSWCSRVSLPKILAMSILLYSACLGRAGAQVTLAPSQILSVADGLHGLRVKDLAVGGGNLYLLAYPAPTFTNAWLVSANPTNGQALWKVPLGSSEVTSFCATPSGMVYVLLLPMEAGGEIILRAFTSTGQTARSRSVPGLGSIACGDGEEVFGLIAGRVSRITDSVSPTRTVSVLAPGEAADYIMLALTGGHTAFVNRFSGSVVIADELEHGPSRSFRLPCANSRGKTGIPETLFVSNNKFYLLTDEAYVLTFDVHTN